MPESIQECCVCQKSGPEVNLLKCGRCKTQSYCGPTCQASDWPTHKSHCRAQNYILKISLCPGDITNPSVTRTLSCPASATFEDLHEALQVAFGWAGTHAFDFKIKDPNAEPEPELSLEDYIAKMKMTMMVGQVNDGPRQNLLRIIDVAGRGIDMMHNASRKHVATPEVSAAKMRLEKVFENKDYKGAEVEYEYDFGDSWRHEITVAGRAAAGNQFVCLDGEGHGVAEDAGSVRGWEKLKEAYRAARPDKEQKEKMEWFEKKASNRDPRGLRGERVKFWDRIGVNVALERL